MIGTLIHCTSCNSLMHMTEGDFSPHYEWNDGEINEIETDDRKAFLHKHKGHNIEHLTPLTPPVSDKPYSEPLKTSYFEATNGTERYLIKRWRNNINEPFSYDIIDGKIVLTNGVLRAQTAAILQQMQADNVTRIPKTKVHHFLQAFSKEVEQLRPDALAVSAEGETPLITYYQLGNRTIDRILTQCQNQFTQAELNELRDFINRHNEYDDVMTVVSKKEFTIQKKTHKEKSPEHSRFEQRFAVSR